jgi:hypothetical protein
MCECSMQCFVQESNASVGFTSDLRGEIEGSLIIGLWYRVVHRSEGNVNFCHDCIESETFPSANFFFFFQKRSFSFILSYNIRLV